MHVDRSGEPKTERAILLLRTLVWYSTSYLPSLYAALTKNYRHVGTAIDFLYDQRHCVSTFSLVWHGHWEAARRTQVKTIPGARNIRIKLECIPNKLSSQFTAFLSRR